MPHRRSIGHAACVVFLLMLAQTVCPQPLEGQIASQSKESHQQRKELRGRVTLTSGDPFCVHVPLKTAHPVNLGAARLTVTLLPEASGGDAVDLVAQLTKTSAMLTPSDSDVELCGTVPLLTARQSGAYRASEYAIHLGSGSAANLGAPDDRMVDTATLARSLESMRLRLAK